MKEIAQYKEEVLARIANEQGRIREKRRSRLTLVYPFALAFAFLILLFPGMPGSPRTVSRPVGSDYTYHEAGTSVHEVAEDKSLDAPSLPAADEAGFGGAGLTDSPEEMTGYRYYFFDVRILPVKDDSALSRRVTLLHVRKSQPLGQTALVSGNGISSARWQTGDGAYLVFSFPGATQRGASKPFFPLLSVTLSDGKPIARRLTEETLGIIEDSDEER